MGFDLAPDRLVRIQLLRVGLNKEASPCGPDAINKGENSVNSGPRTVDFVHTNGRWAQGEIAGVMRRLNLAPVV